MTSTSTAPDALAYAVGDQAHVRFYSDVKPCTVIKRTGHRLTVQMDAAERDPNWKPDVIPGGFMGHVANSGSQKWIITRDEGGRTMDFSLRMNGSWIQCGDRGNGTRLGPGWRKFHDYNF